jgi:hypothetical protein
MKKNKKKVVKMAKPVDDTEIGYKVVTKIDGKLMSATSAGLAVQYKTKEYVKPRMWGGPLTVFCRKDFATEFAKKVGFIEGKKCDTHIYECRYVPTKVCHVWRYRMGGMVMKNVNDLPEKTQLAKKVKLVKMVK